MNNWWEDIEEVNELKAFHEQAVEKMKIPSWVLIRCPFCDKELQHRDIRSIAIMFNARNLGDIAVEFCCEDCKKMDTVYFHQAAGNMEDFVCLMDPRSPSSHPDSEPIIEDKMYSLQYNNLMEKYCVEKEE